MIALIAAVLSLAASHARAAAPAVVPKASPLPVSAPAAPLPQAPLGPAPGLVSAVALRSPSAAASFAAPAPAAGPSPAAGLPISGRSLYSRAEDVARGLHDHKEKVLSRESEPALELMERVVGRLHRRSDPALASVQEAIAHKESDVRALIIEARASGFDQEAVAWAVAAYNDLLLFPKRFLNAWKGKPDMDNLPLFARNYSARRFQAPDLHREPGAFFKQRFVFGPGEADPIQLARARESGPAYVGVLGSPSGSYRGIPADAGEFTAQHLFLASRRKQKDLELFGSMHVYDVQSARRLRGLNAAALDALLLERDALPDARLRAAVAPLLFIALHDNGLSYPLQVAGADRRELAELLLSELSRGEGAVAPSANLFLRKWEENYADRAVDWLLERAARDAASVRAAFRRG